MKSRYAFSVVALALMSACGADTGLNAGETFATADFQKFAVTLQGEDVGHMTMRTEPAGDSLIITQHMEWNLMLMGVQRTVTMEVEARTAQNMDLGYLQMEMSDGTSDIRARAVRSGNTVETTVTTSGRDIVFSSDFQGDYLPAFVDLASATMEWHPGDQMVFPAFDPSTGMIFEATVVCEGIESMSLMGDTVSAARLTISQQGMRNSVWVYEGQIVREEEPGMGMVLTRIPPETRTGIVATGDLYEAYAVTSGIIESPRMSGERTWLLKGDIEWDGFRLDYSGLQSVSEGPVVRVTSYPPASPHAFPMEITDEELLPFLMSEPMIQADDPAIVALADSLTRGAADAWDAAMRISRFVDNAVESVPTVSLPSAVDVLDNLRGDCNEHTVLTVALCRAAGIPAVTCAGVVYVDRGVFGYHAWPAVWAGEWVAMDPTFGQYVADATHIILAQGSMDQQYIVNAVLGRLSIEELEN
jgi:hypothetical protein